MFTPEYLAELVEKTSAAATYFNIYLTNKVIESVIQQFEFDGQIVISPSNKHRLDMLKQSGILMSDIERVIEKRLPALDSKIKEAFYQAGYDINEDINNSVKDMLDADKEMKSFVGDAPRLDNLTEDEKRTLDEAYKRTRGSIKNLTQTTAGQANISFMNACDTAYWKATHGVDKETAIREAIEEVSKNGAYVVYPSGRKMSVEAAVRMCVVTGLNQANAEITLTKCAEMGVRNVLVSSHLGARYTDHDEPANHMSWQGKVYFLSDSLLKKFGYEEKKKSVFGKIKEFFQKFRKEETYPDFEEVTGYRTIEGLCGINCRHTFMPFYKGMKNNQPQYDSEENKKRYDLEQKKRAAERKIRDTKREYENAKHARKEVESKGLTDLAEQLKKKEDALKQRFDSQYNEYGRFCAQNGLKRSDERLFVGKSYSSYKDWLDNNVVGKTVKANGAATRYQNQNK